jgi:DUF4097 and DUF4098 domain-containing protein YvlB
VREQLRRFLPIPLLAVACLYTYKLEVPETHTYAAAGIGRINVTTQNGAVRVAESTATVIRIDVLKYAYGRNREDAEKAMANVVYSDTIVGSELRAKVETPSGSRPYGASFTIAAPDSTNLTLSTTNGDVEVAGLVGNISATTTNGNVELTGTAGTASVSTTNGSLAVSVHSGPLYGATTNGTVDCELAALGPTEDVGLATTNGKVTLLLPDDVSALIDATNTNGFITIYDFTVVYESQTEHHIRGRIGSGASSITITTTNGDIVVRRRS